MPQTTRRLCRRLSRRLPADYPRNSNPSSTPQTKRGFPTGPKARSNGRWSSGAQSRALHFLFALTTADIAQILSLASWGVVNRSPHWLWHPDLVAGVAARRLNGAFGLLSFEEGSTWTGRGQQQTKKNIKVKTRTIRPPGKKLNYSSVLHALLPIPPKTKLKCRFVCFFVSPPPQHCLGEGAGGEGEGAKALAKKL